ncbi:BV/ODV-C42 [Euproctis pseudoconspersa nucleopolyhedrovirus]|uniref:BV/ODV-C42 n=1 Tax=Euproctis pseudoconspersa nucleopolyhedrovirus TaxID=307467 RepID=C3TWZ6_9ABAC|nr:BV/ODV-C42 [Euproctis pseudoconspersa nucleopolyhedrovirus]ACO53538.1 BV/ODV-C42 [Euproctis pseudoconspersa nucleopolyhedrovirus]
MSSVDLFNEIVNLRDKIDARMQMDIWPKLFNLLPESNNDYILNLSFDEFTNFLVNVVAAANNRNATESTTLASEHAVGDATEERERPSSNAPFAPRSVLNVFNKRSDKRYTVSEDENRGTLMVLRKMCQKILQYYSLNVTSVSDFKVGELVGCMLYLSKVSEYRPLYNLLEQPMGESTQCMPDLTPDQMYHMSNLLRSLLNLPAHTIDFDNVKMLRLSLNKIMNYPLARFPRIMVSPNSNLTQDKRRTLEDLILERAPKIASLEPQQYVEGGDSNKIPFCDDEELINELLKQTEHFSLPRMFYNAANSMFYTTLENYAMANCKFEINDYNNIFKTMDEFKQLSEKCNPTRKFLPETTDSLNIYLNGENSLAASTCKRSKKY